MALDDSAVLAAGRLRLELSPSIGGSISSFEWIAEGRARPILRKSNSPRQNVLGAASFPLVPYVNRIRGGCFTFRGREVRLIPTAAAETLLRELKERRHEAVQAVLDRMPHRVQHELLLALVAFSQAAAPSAPADSDSTARSA